MMKALVSYDDTGRVTAVGIRNPDLGDDMVMEVPEGQAVISVEIATVVKGADRVAFGASGDDAQRLQEIVRIIAEGHRVDLGTQHLVPNSKPDPKVA